MDNAELLEKQWKPVTEPLKRILEDHKETQSENRNSDRKRKFTEDNEELIPRKHIVMMPPQGEKRKHKVNIPGYENYDSDTDIDDGTVDLPSAKRPAVVDNTPDDGNMEIESNKLEEMETNLSDSTTQLATPMEEVYESPVTGQDLVKTPEGRKHVKRYIESMFTGNIAKDYFIKLITGGRLIDNNFGVRIEDNNWMIGDKTVDVIDNDLIINGERYEGTRGLYELVFMNSPNPYIYIQRKIKIIMQRFYKLLMSIELIILKWAN